LMQAVIADLALESGGRHRAGDPPGRRGRPRRAPVPAPRPPRGEVPGVQAGARGGRRGAGMPGRQRLRRGFRAAAPLPRGAAQLDLGGLRATSPRWTCCARSPASPMPWRRSSPSWTPRRAPTSGSTAPVRELRAELRSREPRRARRMAELLALCLQGSLLLRHGPRRGRGRVRGLPLPPRRARGARRARSRSTP
jgi:hypothetical protein